MTRVTYLGVIPISSYFISESLRQNTFWLRIMKEHLLFIRIGLPCEEQAMRAEAQRLENEAGRLLDEARHLGGSANEKKIFEFNRNVISLLTAIIGFKSRVLRTLVCCEVPPVANFPLILDHIRREAIYFRAALVRLNEKIPVGPVEMFIQEEVFWLRIMADHSKFIAHLLDPAERGFVRLAMDFSKRFDELRFIAEDFETMLVPRTFENSLLPDAGMPPKRPAVFGKGLPEPYNVGSLDRFAGETISATGDLLDFKRTARDLIAACRVLSYINPLLADHVVREAERAIEDLTIFRRHLPPPCGKSPLKSFE